MNAIDLVVQQHREVERAFEELEEAASEDKRELFEALASMLVAHDAIERQIFYPACERAVDEENVLRESLVEHGLVEFCLFNADRKRGDELDSYVKVLKDLVMHHVEEEESELLPKARRDIDEDMLESLGEQMESLFDEVRSRDYRRPLAANVKQVIAGRTKTVAKRPPTTARTSARSGAPRKAASGKRKGTARKPSARGRASRAR